MDKKPTGKIIKDIIIGPKEWEKLEMVTIKEPIHDYDKIYWGYCVACPMLEQYVHPSECQSCDFGRLGSYKEKYTICSYNKSKEDNN